MSRIRVRQAESADVDAIAGLLEEAEAWLRQRGIPMWSPEELSPRALARAVAAGMHFVAEVDGEFAGTLRFQLRDPEFWPDLADGDGAFVHRLAVRRRFAGKGVGEALLDWAAHRAADLGREYLRLDCDSDRPRLRAFYERNGFRHHSDRQVGPHHVARYERLVGTPERQPEG